MRTLANWPKVLLGVAIVACFLWAVEWPAYPPVLGFWGQPQVNGVLVTRVAPGGGAEAAGVRAGDVVYTVNGYAVQTGRQVRAALRDKTPGETVAVEFMRDGRFYQTDVKLRARGELPE